MEKAYKTNSSPNVHWGYYVYDKNIFNETLIEIDSLEENEDTKSIVRIANLLKHELEASYKRIKEDKVFLEFNSYNSISPDTSKYIDLYYNVAKSHLAKIVDSPRDNDFKESVDILQDYYLRYKASIFFKDAWFYLNKYHISDGFFKVFIDSSIYQEMLESNNRDYASRELYLNIFFKNSAAENILNKLERTDTEKLFNNDRIFIEGLKNLIEGKSLILYKSD